MFWVVGFGDDDFMKFIVGIVNGYSIIIFCNMGINDLVLWVEVGLWIVGVMF